MTYRLRNIGIAIVLAVVAALLTTFYGAVLAITGWFNYFALIATRIVLAPVVTAIAFEIQRQASLRAPLVLKRSPTVS